MRILLAVCRVAVARASRTAEPSGHAWNIAKTLAQASVLWLVFLWVLPQIALKLDRKLPGGPKYLPGRWKVAGPLLFVCGGAFGLWSGAVLVVRGRGTPLPLDATREMVAAGPYAHVRNPMAMGSLLQGVGVALWLRSPLALAYALCGIPFWNWTLRPGEEDALEARFGEDYSHYKSRVRCWIPRLRPYDAGE